MMINVIDMHLHTVFSDGSIDDLSMISKKCNKFAVTDHNSIIAYKEFGKLYNKQMLIGCEITVDRAPDMLVYFTEDDRFNEIEQMLCDNIRLKEEQVIHNCYNSLGFKDWETDIKRAFNKNCKIRNARTRDLAAILYLYNNNLQYADGYFTSDELRKARSLRNKYADEIGNPVSEEFAYSFAEKFGGKLVLAHPIHTAIKKSGRNGDFNTIKNKLINLLNNCTEKEGKYIEWEFFSSSHLSRYGLSNKELIELENYVLSFANKNSLLFTIGSDSHQLAEYDSYIRWYNENIEIIKHRLPDWIL